MRKPNDVGVAWKKTNERGDYLSIALDLDVLVEMTGGAIEKVNLNAYPIISDHPKAPDYQLKYYPKTGTAPRPRTPPPAPEGPDDDIPW